MIKPEQKEKILEIVNEEKLEELIKEYPPIARNTRCKDLTGMHQPYGMWTALYRVENKQKGHACWLCIHDDGYSFKEIQQDHFASGHSAGIIKTRCVGPTTGGERPDKRVDLTGQIFFNRYKAICQTGIRGVGDNRMEWLVEDLVCGKQFTVDSHSLQNGAFVHYC